MNQSRSLSSFTRRTFAAALIVFIAGVAACGGGSTNSSADDSATIAALQTTVAALQAQVNTLQGTVKTVQGKQATDESTISRIALLGHPPGTSTVFAERAARTESILLPGAQAQATDFGQCPDMGQFIGASTPDPTSGTVQFFKQCTGNVYGVNVEDGTVYKPLTMWFTSSDCTTGPIQFENDGQFNSQTLLGGVVFDSPVDGSEVWVQPSTTKQQMTSHSIFTNGTCTPSVSETHNGYIVVPNVTDTVGSVTGSGVPASVPPYVL